MSDEIKNEDVIEESPVVPATLSEGEPVIPASLAEKYEAAVQEQTEKAEEVKEEPAVEPEPTPEPELVEEPKNVVTTGSQRVGKSQEEVAGLVSINNGVIGTGSVKPKAKPKSASKTGEAKDEKVAVYSTRNVTWSGVGKVYRGYNIVSKEAADKWLTRDHVRVATPAEVAQEFGK